MEDVCFLEVVFENCESIVIPIERIVDFSYGTLTHLTDEMFTEGNYYETDYLLLKIRYFNESELQYLDSDYDNPLGMFTNNPSSNNVSDRPNILGRLIIHEDIVGVWLLDENKEVIKVIYAPWGDEEYVNTSMTINTKDGLIDISIKE